ncbi:MAG: AsnC family protein, partial [Thermoproteota archaeon]
MESVIDELDLKILREFIEDSRVTYREIAKKLGIAPGTVLS